MSERSARQRPAPPSAFASPAQDPTGDGAQGWAPGSGWAVGARMRSVLSLASAARVAMSRRMRISLHDLSAIELVMTSQGEDGPAAFGPSELARRLGVTTAATTQALHRLEASGHVRRRPHPDDRRRQVVEVTPEGAEHVFAVLSPLLRRLEAQAATLTAAEQRAVLKYLEGQEAAYEQFLAELAATPAPDPPADAGSDSGRGS